MSRKVQRGRIKRRVLSEEKKRLEGKDGVKKNVGWEKNREKRWREKKPRKRLV